MLHTSAGWFRDFTCFCAFLTCFQGFQSVALAGPTGVQESAPVRREPSIVQSLARTAQDAAPDQAVNRVKAAHPTSGATLQSRRSLASTGDAPRPVLKTPRPAKPAVLAPWAAL